MALRIGIMADPQYAAIPTWGTRHFTASLDKVRAAIEVFNQEPLDFCVTLGDLVDRDRASFGQVLPLFDRLRHDHHFVLGNHDFLVEPEELAAIPALLGRTERWSSFAIGQWRIIIVDGTEIGVFSTPKGTPEHEAAKSKLRSLVKAKALQAQPWNATMSEGQFRWLDQELAAADREGQRALILGHYPVYPANDHNLWDDQRFVAIVTAHPSFVAYLNGHNHVGNHGQVDGRHFVTFKGMVDTPDQSAFAIVEIDGDRLEIRGYGREESRSLAIRG